MRVELDYFKSNGTYYTSGSYDTKLEDLAEIWLEVGEMFNHRTLPGLCRMHDYFIVLIDVPYHSYNHPRLII